MKDKTVDLFSTEAGQKTFDAFVCFVKEHALDERLSKGVAVACSGGGDSVLLLHLLLAYSRRYVALPMTVVHVHHGLRAAEADRDAAFVEELCHSLDVPCVIQRCDVSTYAEAHGLGTEEAARVLRYRALREVCQARGLSYIVTAHHATDQLETVLFHLTRGTGLRGLCGMSAISADILRPMLALTREDVNICLEAEKLPYVTDSTNDSDAYMRNYIRHEIVPRLRHIVPTPERSVLRMTEHLQADDAHLSRESRTAFAAALTERGLRTETLLQADGALRPRMLALLVREATEVVPSTVHIRALERLLRRGGAFSYALPGGVLAVCDGEHLTVRGAPLTQDEPSMREPMPVSMGITHFDAWGFSLALAEEKKTDFSSNVYKFSIQADLSSAIIEGALTLRFRREGDAYRYGGMTHKLKKLLIDRHIPSACRAVLPILCDERGILWVPGFGVRDDGGRRGRGPYAVFLAHEAFPSDAL